MIPLYVLKKIIRRGIRALHTTNQKRTGSSNTTKKALEHVVQRATDRRRGLIEVCSLSDYKYLNIRNQIKQVVGGCLEILLLF